MNPHPHKALSSVILIALLLCVGFAQASPAHKSSDTLQVSVNAVPQSKVKAVQGRVLVNAPPRFVWQILTDYPDWQHRIPGYERTTLKSVSPYKTLDVAMKVSPLLPPCRYQVQVQEQEENYRLGFQRISGDFTAMKAAYQLIPQNNSAQTLIKYTLYIDIGKPLPGISSILKASTEKTLSALKRHSELEASRSAIGHR